MKCFAAHYLYLGDGKLLTRHVVCLDQNGCISSIQPLQEETASTVFLNGLICAAFCLPGSNNILPLNEVKALFGRVRNMDPMLEVGDLLQFYTSNTELKIGTKPALWCIEPIDLKNQLLKEDSSVYSVFP